MAKAIAVNAEKRAGKGTSVSRSLRRSGHVPGVVYGDGKAGLNIQLNSHEFSRALGAHLDEHVLVDLNVAQVGEKKVLLQDVQHHPVTGDVIHVDFHEISMTKKLRVEVPVKLVGDPVGVTQQGGVLEYLVRQLMVECLPLDIPDHVDVDVSALTVGQSLSVADLKLEGAKFRIVSDAGIAVAAVTAPREEEAAAAPAAGTAEPEVLREKKVEGEEAAAAGKDGAKKEGAAKEGAKPAAKDAAKPAAKEAKK